MYTVFLLGFSLVFIRICFASSTQLTFDRFGPSETNTWLSDFFSFEFRKQHLSAFLEHGYVQVEGVFLLIGYDDLSVPWSSYVEGFLPLPCNMNRPAHPRPSRRQQISALQPMRIICELMHMPPSLINSEVGSGRFLVHLKREQEDENRQGLGRGRGQHQMQGQDHLQGQGQMQRQMQRHGDAQARGRDQGQRQNEGQSQYDRQLVAYGPELLRLDQSIP